MGARPPQNNNDDPEVIEFGIAAVDARLKNADLTFPATATEIVDEIGQSDIPYDAKGRSMSLEKAIQRTGKREFDNRQELLNSLHFIFEEQRNERSGFLDQVRALLPF